MSRRIAVVLWLFLQPIVFHWRALVTQTTYLPFDLPGFHTPLATTVVEALSQRRFPFWDPYIYAGYPIHADIQAQILYPPAWPAFLISALGQHHTIFYWLEWQTVLHISLAGLFAAWLLRRLGCDWAAALFGATVFQLGCFFSAQAQHLGAVCGVAWMPLAWLAVTELAESFSARWFAALAAALAMNLLAGFPSTSLIVFGSALALALAYWWTGRARPMLLIWLAAAIAVSLALAAAQLVPTMVWSPHSISSWRWKWASGGGLPPKVFLTALWPDWFHALSSELYREPYSITFMYVYNGQAALWLALAAPWLRSRSTARLFAALAGFFALLMLGTAVPGYQFLFLRLPRFVRGASYVEYTTSAFTLALAVAAALALHHLTQGKRAWIAVVIAAATSVELTLVASNRTMNATTGDWRSVDSSRNYYESDSLLKQLKSFLNESTPPLRTDTTQHEYRHVTVVQAVRVSSLSGDNPIAPLRMLAYRKLFCDWLEWERQYNVKDTASPLLDAGNVGFLLYDGDSSKEEEPLKRAGWAKIPLDTAAPLKVFRNREAMPRYFLVSSVKHAGSSSEAEALLKAADPRREAIVEGSPAMAETRVDDWTPVGVISYRPDRVELRTIASGPAYLVAAESWAPGWEARIDGRPAPIYPTNLAFQGLPVPPGAHIVTLEYVPRGSYAAAAVSAVAWISLAASFWISWRRRAAVPS